VSEKQRQGILVKPYCRLSKTQIKLIDWVSRELLEDPGILTKSPSIADTFKAAGAGIERQDLCYRIRISSALIDQALATAPARIILGARDPDNRLILDAQEPRMRFGTGSEANTCLDVNFDEDQEVFTHKAGSIGLLGRAAHLAEHLDFFIRTLNIQDEEVTIENKDVNMFGVCLNNTTKHVQAGLTSLEALNHVIKIGEIVAGGPKAFTENPVLSFITSTIKSPLQIVDDSAQKQIAIARHKIPLVLSSSPMAGTTAPFDEFGIVAQVNAEILAGVTLHQLACPGAPVMYGAVPVRTRLDNLNDMYGVPDFIHFNTDCAQMARFYGLPCYTTLGISDAALPGIQATAEKMLTHAAIPQSGAQYAHCAFGIMERSTTFCPVQAVIDNAHIGMVKDIFVQPRVLEDRRRDILGMIREVMATDHKTFVYHLPLPSRQNVYVHYPLEEQKDNTLLAACRRYQEIMGRPRRHLPPNVQEKIKREIPGILPQTMA
jgi:trimethylamine--corrinoid protein Co-methyltransferase